MYTWMENDNCDIWNRGEFETIEECIEEALDCGYELGETIYVGECQKVEVGGIYFDDVLERVEETMYEEVGEVSEGWDISSITGAYSDRKEIYEKYQNKLENLVMEYIKEIKEIPRFYKVVNVGPVKVEKSKNKNV